MQRTIFLRIVRPTFFGLLIGFTLWSNINFAHAAPEQKVYYFLHDHLGGISAVTDEEGNVVERRDYLPYGAERLLDATDLPAKAGVTDYGFTGKEKDPESELYYYGARYYDPFIGRFINQDPWEGDLTNPQTLNKYSYALNNPLKYIDPTGERVSEYQPYIAKGTKHAYGELMGTYRGINITSAGPQKTGEGNHPYQCVAFVKAFVSYQYGVNLGSAGNAVNYGNQEKLNQALPKEAAGLFTVYNNRGSVMPQENDIISWSGGEWGHVGIIAEVTFEEESGTGWVYTLEQNEDPNSGLFQQSFTRTYNDKGEAVYTINGRDGFNVQGWARYEKQNKTDDNPVYTSTPHTPASQIPKKPEEKP